MSMRPDSGDPVESVLLGLRKGELVIFCSFDYFAIDIRLVSELWQRRRCGEQMSIRKVTKYCVAPLSFKAMGKDSSLLFNALCILK